MDGLDQRRKTEEKLNLCLSILGNSKRTLRRRPATVGTQFKISIGALLNNLTSKHCLFVRCIKPNESRLSRVFDMTLVQHQIRYLGYVSLCHRWLSPLHIKVSLKLDISFPALLSWPDSGGTASPSGSSTGPSWRGSRCSVRTPGPPGTDLL